jgi:hypothetical protein
VGEPLVPPRARSLTAVASVSASGPGRGCLRLAADSVAIAVGRIVNEENRIAASKFAGERAWLLLVSVVLGATAGWSAYWAWEWSAAATSALGFTRSPRPRSELARFWSPLNC